MITSARIEVAELLIGCRHPLLAEERRRRRQDLPDPS